MIKEIRTAVYDTELKIEICRFEALVQPFPNHFHEYYVIGFIEDGERRLSCKNRHYIIGTGGIVLFNPGDNHDCSPNNGKALYYRGLNIPKDVMLDLAHEITGKRELPRFSKNVIFDDEAACYLRPLHEMAMKNIAGFGKEECFLLLVSRLIQKYGQPFDNSLPECRREIEKACEFIERHFSERIYLEQICRYAGLSKSTLLRAFTKSKGVTPYRYLEAIRINEAKRLLANGASPASAALQTGFSDQSHFTNYFSSFIGLAPGAYREIFNKKNKNREERHGD